MTWSKDEQETPHGLISQAGKNNPHDHDQSCEQQFRRQRDIAQKLARMGVLLAAAAVLGALGPQVAQAIITDTNRGDVDYDNEAGSAQPTVSDTANFTRKSSPVLSVVKTVDNPTPAIGDTVTYTITVSYPRIADVPLVCGDDSAAQSIVFTDVIPARVTYTAGTLTLAENGGAPVTLTDAADADAGEVVTGTVTVRPSNMNEGDGDAACTPANTRVITFQGVVNGS